MDFDFHTLAMNLMHPNDMLLYTLRIELSIFTVGLSISNIFLYRCQEKEDSACSLLLKFFFANLQQISEE